MLYEPTTLASVARLIGETLETDYQVDPRPFFEKLRLDTTKFYTPGARVSFGKMDSLWRMAIEATGDDQFGFRVGEHATASDFFVLGHAWLASETLLGALRRLCRYRHVLSTAYGELELQRREDHYALTESYREGAVIPQKAARDGGYVAFLKLIDLVARHTVRPIRVDLTVPPESGSRYYDDLFRCPITYGSDEDVWIFSAEDLEKPLTGSIPEVASATDRIADNYLASLDESPVTTSVRELLVKLLPSGRAEQERIAKRLYRSTSTLQRQLNGEGTNYRQVLESTRRDLAEHYLRESDYSQAQIAFMVGFADQSNFARAFKRWTGVSPGEYKKAA